MSVKRWLAQGWSDFNATRGISVGFCSIFVVFGLLLFLLLNHYQLNLAIYPLLTGFMLVAPLLVSGFQRAARLLRQGRQPRFADLLLGITEATPGIWFLTFILLLCYLIWVTDAFIIYAIYFGFTVVPIDSQLLNDPQMQSLLFSYLFWSGLMGLLIALIGFSVGAFSIPLILHRKTPFVEAVQTSAVTVFRHPAVMLRWALTLSIGVLLTLAVAIPLLVIVLPVFAYASHAAFVEVLPPDEAK